MLSEDCQTGVRRGADLALGLTEKIDVISIDVWGCGSQVHSSEQNAQRDRDHRMALQHQKVL
jgi:hypothetical protein